ncbi:hypothetical protein RJD24_11450 [Bacillaceae bacterium IKA-2]|nr:hypothetical protein RJD24_11450 [Bacillaceae bacterium IKA-2]
MGIRVIDSGEVTWQLVNTIAQKNNTWLFMQVSITIKVCRI